MPLNAPDPSQAPVALRVLIGALGALSLLAGARLYKPALLGSAFAAGAVGVYAAANVAPIPDLEPTAILVAALCVGLLVAILAGIAHRMALVAIGGVIGTVVGLVVASSFALPFWIPLVGAAVGALAFPWTLQPVLKVVTPAMGAVLVGWSVAMLENPLVVGVLFVMGVLVQFAIVGSAPKKAKDDE